MTTQQRIDFVKLSACVSIFAAMITIILTPQLWVALAGHAVLAGAYTLIFLAFKLEHRLLQEETTAMEQRYLNTISDRDLFPAAMGDKTCRFNAHSSHLRCAVNPSGPCEGCQHYQSNTHDK